MKIKTVLRNFLFGSGVGVLSQLGYFLFGQSDNSAVILFGYLLAPPILLSLKAGLSDGALFAVATLYCGTVGMLIGAASRKRAVLVAIILLLGLFHTWSYFLIEEIFDSVGRFFADHFFK